jgi:glutathione S-transferase
MLSAAIWQVCVIRLGEARETAMIVLSGGGPNFGLPEISPYVTKTEVQLRIAGIPFEKRFAHPQEGPKGQIPFIEDGGRMIGDSAFIRMHVEQEYGVDLDAGLSPEQRAIAFAIESMVDHQLAPAVGYFRWLVPANFAKGPAQFFAFVPADQRDAFMEDVLKRVRADSVARGAGRHSEEEIAHVAARALRAIELLLADKPYLMGDAPVGADAFVFAVLAGAITPFFDTPVRDHAISSPTLVAYVDRMMARFYPDFAWDAGAQHFSKAA